MQLACQWNLAHEAVACVVPTLIQETGPGARPVEQKRAELAALPSQVRLSGADLDAIAAVGDGARRAAGRQRPVAVIRIIEADGFQVDWEMRMRRRALRADLAVGLGFVLPLQTLPATNRHGGISQRPRRARFVPRAAGRRSTAGLEARRWLGEMVLWRLRLCHVQPRSGRPVSDRDPPRDAGFGPRHPAERAAVPGLGGALGADPGRRADAASGTARLVIESGAGQGR